MLKHLARISSLTPPREAVPAIAPTTQMGRLRLRGFAWCPGVAGPDSGCGIQFPADTRMGALSFGPGKPLEAKGRAAAWATLMGRSLWLPTALVTPLRTRSAWSRGPSVGASGRTLAGSADIPEHKSSLSG